MDVPVNCRTSCPRKLRYKRTNMQLSRKKVCLVLVLFAVSSASAQSLEKQDDSELKSYDDLLKSIDNLKNIFIVGPSIAPIAATVKGAFLILNEATDGNLANVINSVMPCKLNGLSSKCEGKLDTGSVSKIAKKLLENIPLDALPKPAAYAVKFAIDKI